MRLRQTAQTQSARGSHAASQRHWKFVQRSCVRTSGFQFSILLFSVFHFAWIKKQLRHRQLELCCRCLLCLLIYETFLISQGNLGAFFFSTAAYYCAFAFIQTDILPAHNDNALFLFIHRTQFEWMARIYGYVEVAMYVMNIWVITHYAHSSLLLAKCTSVVHFRLLLLHNLRLPIFFSFIVWTAHQSSEDPIQKSVAMDIPKDVTQSKPCRIWLLLMIVLPMIIIPRKNS